MTGAPETSTWGQCSRGRSTDLSAILRCSPLLPLIDPEVYTLVWPNGADFDPSVLHDWPKHEQAMREPERRVPATWISCNQGRFGRRRFPRGWKSFAPAPPRGSRGRSGGRRGRSPLPGGRSRGGGAPPAFPSGRSRGRRGPSTFLRAPSRGTAPSPRGKAASPWGTAGSPPSVHRDGKRYGTLPLGDGGIPLGDGGVPLEGPRKIREGAGVPPGDDARPLDGPQRPLEGKRP
jgi:hypothetical protein